MYINRFRGHFYYLPLGQENKDAVTVDVVRAGKVFYKIIAQLNDLASHVVIRFMGIKDADFDL